MIYDMSSSIIHIDTSRARDIAMRFLEQHHSIVNVKNITLKKRIWTVEVAVSAFGFHNMRVMLDSRTGRIVGWE